MRSFVLSPPSSVSASQSLRKWWYRSDRHMAYSLSPVFLPWSHGESESTNKLIQQASLYMFCTVHSAVADVHQRSERICLFESTRPVLGHQRVRYRRCRPGIRQGRREACTSGNRICPDGYRYGVSRRTGQYPAETVCGGAEKEVGRAESKGHLRQFPDQCKSSIRQSGGPGDPRRGTTRSKATRADW